MRSSFVAAAVAGLALGVGCAQTVTEAPEGIGPTCRETCSGCCFGEECLTAFSGCGGTTCGECATCNPSLCDGCCVAGRCLPLDGEAACGTRGGPCRVCVAPSTCSDGRCLGLQGEACRDETPCADGFACERDWVYGNSFFSVFISLSGTCRARCAETDCGDGLQCHSGLRLCMAEVGPSSRWGLTVFGGSVRNPARWDGEEDPPDLVGCVTVAGRRACSPANSEDFTWHHRIPGTFTAEELRAAIVTLWDDDGAQPFAGCAGTSCEHWDRTEREELSSAEADGRLIELVPSRDFWWSSRRVFWPEGQLVLFLQLDERP